MVSLSPEQFERFMTEIFGRMAATAPVEGPENITKKRILHEKGFNRVTKFSQGGHLLPEWAFDFKVAMGAQSAHMREYLDHAEKQQDIVSFQQAVNFDTDRASSTRSW